MKYSEWKSFYDQIILDLHLDKEKDETSSQIFDQLINSYSTHYISDDTLLSLIQGKNVCVFGAAPTLLEDIFDHKEVFDNTINIAADGATTALIKYNIIPDIIVTDLDGVIADQLRANERQSILIIHAHGDNISIVQKTLPKIQGPYFGTIQTNPLSYRNVKNFGGFTDGDRAVFIADHFKAQNIILVGFDCTAKPGFYSFQIQQNQSRKRKKLEWCQKLLDQFPKEYVKSI